MGRERRNPRVGGVRQNLPCRVTPGRLQPAASGGLGEPAPQQQQQRRRPSTANSSVSSVSSTASAEPQLSRRGAPHHRPAERWLRPWGTHSDPQAWHTPLDRPDADLPVAASTSVRCRVEPLRKDHRLYETQQERDKRKRRSALVDQRHGALYDVHPFGRHGLGLGGTAGGVEMRQTSFDLGANELLRRAALRPAPYRDGAPLIPPPPPSPSLPPPWAKGCGLTSVLGLGGSF
jgi:hypothetical protein